MKFYDTVESKISINDILSLIPIGKNNAVVSDVIAHRLNVSDRKTQVYVRKVIRDAIEDGYLIGSCAKGYFIIQTAQEFIDYINSLESRQKGIQKRINSLRGNWNSNGQVRLRI